MTIPLTKTPLIKTSYDDYIIENHVIDNDVIDNDVINMNIGIVGEITNTSKFINQLYLTLSDPFAVIDKKINNIHLRSAHICNQESEDTICKLIEFTNDVADLTFSDLNEFIKSDNLDFIIFLVNISQMYDTDYLEHICNILSNLDIDHYDRFVQFVIMNDSNDSNNSDEIIDNDWINNIIEKVLNIFSIVHSNIKHNPRDAMFNLMNTMNTMSRKKEQGYTQYPLYDTDFYKMDFNDPYILQKNKIKVKTTDDEIKTLIANINVWVRQRCK